jgi:hypothetical protein
MDLSTATRVRERLRRPGDALAAAPITAVPILWSNDAGHSLAGPPSEAASIGRRVLQSALRRLGRERAA